MTMVRTYPGWDRLNELGIKYYEEVQRGYDTTFDERTNLRNRSDLQIRLANEIIDGSIGLIKKIAIDVLHGKGFKISNNANKKGFFTLSLKYTKQITDISDLVSYGSIGVIEDIHNFDPTKGSISTFIGYTAATKMYREASINSTLIYIPTYLYERAIKIIRKSRNKKEALDKLQFEDNTIRMNRDRASLLYELIKGEYLDIDKILSGSEDDSPDSEKWADRYLVDTNKPSAEEAIDNKKIEEIVGIVLATLLPRERKILRLRFGIGDDNAKTLAEIGSDFEVTRERIYQIESRALRKLRHPIRSKVLKPYTEN